MPVEAPVLKIALPAISGIASFAVSMSFSPDRTA
jgi:hypothetical protein